MTKETQNAASDKQAAFFTLVNQPLKMRLYLLKKLPAAFFCGLRVDDASETSCTVSVPYNYITKNPFRSTYFACLGMAAELSTGILAMANTYGRKPPFSMLITRMEARFHKKAVGKTWFTCADGDKIKQAVSAANHTKTGQEVSASSIGKNEAGERIAEFWFTWSFRIKEKR